MKTINYTGSSKLISRIVNLLNRRAPLPLDGDGDPDWGTNGQVLSTDGSGNTAWVNQGGGGSGGHTIEDTSGADLPQEDNLQFVGVYTRDDSVNSRTEVNIVRQMTKAAMEALSSAEKEGFIDTTDEDDDYIPIAAEDVKYGNTDVESALDSINAQISGGGRTVTLLVDESVSIGNGQSKTYGTLTATYLNQFDEISLFCKWGVKCGVALITKKQMQYLAAYNGYIGLYAPTTWNAAVYISVTETMIRNLSSDGIDYVMMQGIKYNY